MPVEDGADATLNAIIAVAGPAFNVGSSPYFTVEEDVKLRDEAQKLWSTGHWLRMFLHDNINALRICSANSSLPTFDQLDESLAAIILSSFWIGAASYVHPANKRHIKSVEMQSIRKAKARSPLQIKRDRIKKTVLPPLLAAGASRTEQIIALDAALKVEGAGKISPAGADRWRKEVLAMMSLPKTSD